MRTKGWLLGAALAVGAGGIGVAAADPQKSPPKQTQSQQTSGQSEWVVEGRVIKVDDDDVKISRANGPNIEFDVNRDTTIRVNGANAQLRDLQQGAEVRVRFDLSDDDTLAQEIEVVTASSAPTKR